ncbi:MAG: chorismate synthase [Erysipelotrichaceae bacterium]|nr:chorismate synthase [Erysipelotrichaceae bacterium]
MQNLFSFLSITLSRYENNKIIVNIENLKIDFYIDLENIKKIIYEIYPNIKIEFINFQERKNNKNFLIILTLINQETSHEIINPENNHLYYLDQYNTTITNNMILKYNVIAICIVGLIIKEILLNKYKITIFTHINSIGNIYDTVNDYNKLLIDLYKFKNDKLPIVDSRAKIMMQKLLNKTINEKKSISGSLQTIIYNLPKGLGYPYFNLFESSISKILYLIPSLKSLEFSNVYKINNELIQPIKNISFVDDKLLYDSNIYYGVEQGITTGDFVYFNTHFIPPLIYQKNSISINYKTLENTYIEPIKQEYFTMHKNIFQVEALTAISIYEMIRMK